MTGRCYYLRSRRHDQRGQILHGAVPLKHGLHGPRCRGRCRLQTLLTAPSHRHLERDLLAAPLNLPIFAQLWMQPKHTARTFADEWPHAGGTNTSARRTQRRCHYVHRQPYRLVIPSRRNCHQCRLSPSSMGPLTANTIVNTTCCSPNSRTEFTTNYRVPPPRKISTKSGLPAPENLDNY